MVDIIELEKVLVELQKINSKFNLNKVYDSYIINIFCKGAKQISVKTVHIAFNDKTKLVLSTQRFKRSEYSDEFLDLFSKYMPLHNELKSAYKPFNEYYSFEGFQSYDATSKVISFIEHDKTMNISSAMAGHPACEGYKNKTCSIEEFIGEKQWLKLK